MRCRRLVIKLNRTEPFFAVIHKTWSKYNGIDRVVDTKNECLGLLVDADGPSDCAPTAIIKKWNTLIQLMMIEICYTPLQRSRIFFGSFFSIDYLFLTWRLNVKTATTVNKNERFHLTFSCRKTSVSVLFLLLTKKPLY